MSLDAKLLATSVVGLHRWNPVLFSFSVTRPEGYAFRAGEFAMVGMIVNQRPVMRSYSIASPPSAAHLEFLSVEVSGGELTAHLKDIVPGDAMLVGRKATGTLLADALLPGSRLFMLGTGTGLAPFLSIARTPEFYERFEQLVIVHSVREIADLAYCAVLESAFADEPAVAEAAREQLRYVPTVTREDFRTRGRIGDLIDSGALFEHVDGARDFDPATDRIMMCGSAAMLRDFGARFAGIGFSEGGRHRPGHYVVERAYAD